MATIDASRSPALLVDLRNDFLHPDGAYASVFATGYSLGEMAPDGPGDNDDIVAAFDHETPAQQ